MLRNVTIIMYHYVRELEHSRYPEIKGLPYKKFKEQLIYLKKYYQIITMEEVIDAVKNKHTLPPRSALLTFDDGYIDHFTNVFPLLDEYNIQGSFFPPGRCIENRKVLSVNKIHFILATVLNKNDIINQIFHLLDEARTEYTLPSNQNLYEKLAIPSRFDSGEVIFIKRILQKELPATLRDRIVNSLFERFVTTDEESLANELYLDLNQLKCMQRHGMFIGSHTMNHDWLDSLTIEEQYNEIDESLRFLEKIGSPTKDWVMCYPYGAYNTATLDILKMKNCALGLVTKVDIANLDSDNPLTLPRLDTNDLPQASSTTPNIWHQKASTENTVHS